LSDRRGPNIGWVTGPNLVSGPGCPLCPGNARGYDDLSIAIVDCDTVFVTSSVQNTYQTLSTNLVNVNKAMGTYSITDVDSLIVIATFPFEGLVILPVGDEGGNIELKNLNEIVGNI
jgi:hypothetical protein